LTWCYWRRGVPVKFRRAQIRWSRPRDKPTVLALREIAENLINASSMDEMEAQAEIEKIATDDDLIRQIAQASMEAEEAPE
jgi:hypothetical protein